MSASCYWPSSFLDELSGFPSRLKRQVACLSDAMLDFVPADWSGIPSERLTVRQQICHLRDIEIDGYHVRIRRTLAEEFPILGSIDGYALCRERRYDEIPVETALANFEEARVSSIRILRQLQPGDLSRPAHFDGIGPVTLVGLVHMLASHDSQHIAGIHWLIGKSIQPN